MKQSHKSSMVLPADREMKAAIESQRTLSIHLSTELETQRIQIFDQQNQAHPVELPTTALRLLVDILSELAEGNAVKVVPLQAELTTQEAANLLNVSRPHLIKLLQTHSLPHHTTGKHRRIKLADLMCFKAERERASQQAMRALARQAQELGMGYE